MADVGCRRHLGRSGGPRRERPRPPDHPPRSHPALLGFHARLGADGEPLIDGLGWTAPALAAGVRAAVGDGAHLVRYDGLERFDVLPLLVATDGAIAALGVDRRRLQPNIVVAGVAGLAEREWPGRRLRVGSAVIRAAKLPPALCDDDLRPRHARPGILRVLAENRRRVRRSNGARLRGARRRAGWRSVESGRMLEDELR